jgi:hypothetical protein
MHTWDEPWRLGAHAVGRLPELLMPLTRSLLSSVVQITSAGTINGTGMLIAVPSEAKPDLSWVYVLTADHVIRHQLELAVHAPDPNSQAPKLYAPVPVSDWRQPLKEVDLALAPFPARLPDGPIAPLRLEDMLPAKQVPMLGAEVYYVGIFAPLRVPMARGGTLGAVNVPIGQSKEGHSRVGHLVDCRSYGGFSGSPCFVQTVLASDVPSKLQLSETQLSAAIQPDGSMPAFTSLWYAPLFFGVFTGHFTDEAAEATDGVVSRFGVGVMVRHTEVLKAIMSDELRQERQERDEALSAL